MDEYEDIPDAVLALALQELAFLENSSPGPSRSPEPSMYAGFGNQLGRTTYTSPPRESRLFRPPPTPPPIAPVTATLQTLQPLPREVPVIEQPPREPSPPPYSADVPAADVESRYQDLRVQAIGQGKLMAARYEASQKAYRTGDRDFAKILSMDGNEHKAEMERLNKEASDMIFRKNNAHRDPYEMDLHGQFVSEAIARTDAAILSARRNSVAELRIIVGRGRHSTGSDPKLRRAVDQHLTRSNVPYRYDFVNDGVLIIELGQDPTAGGGSERPPAIQTL